VTHDQDEALALSDRIAVMNAGKIVQMGTPREIYREPAAPFIADFVGHSNLLAGTPVDRGDGGLAVRLDDAQSIALPRIPQGERRARLQVAIRPEHVGLAAPGEGSGENVLRGRIIQRDFLGTRFEYVIAVGDSVLRATSAEEHELGEVAAVLPAKHCMPFWG
jgi:iron(III) transport system ATP-binding protein